MTKAVLMSLLAAGEFRSGQDLAEALGVSRTAVWKQLNKLAEQGLQVESVKGKGYRIVGGLDLLNETVLRAELNAEAASLLTELSLLPQIDSTNAELLRQLEAGAGRGLVCAAEQQSAGRGRRGREWVSPFAANLYFSLAWEFDGGAAALEGLSLAVGVAVSEALASCGLAGLQLKWPNDLLYKGAKLGGVLLEMAGDAAGTCKVVVGVGLNVAMPADAAGAIDQTWTDVAVIAAEQGVPAPSRSELLAALLNQLLPLLANFSAGGFAVWRQRWLALDAYADQKVVIIAGAQQTAGIARGVDERGALQLETTLGLQSIFGGEISMRPAS